MSWSYSADVLPVIDSCVVAVLPRESEATVRSPTVSRITPPTELPPGANVPDDTITAPPKVPEPPR